MADRPSKATPQSPTDGAKAGRNTTSRPYIHTACRELASCHRLPCNGRRTSYWRKAISGTDRHFAWRRGQLVAHARTCVACVCGNPGPSSQAIS